MSQVATHQWILAPYRRDREETYQALLPEMETTHVYQIDCHRNLRGPYTGTGELIRLLAPEIQRIEPELLSRHGLAAASVAPELKEMVALPQEILDALVIPEERTNFHPRQRTLRIAHGIADLLLAYYRSAKLSRLVLIFENVHLAEPLDQECIAVLLRRTNPLCCLIVIGTSETVESLSPLLASALTQYAQMVQCSPLPLDASEGWQRVGKHAASWKKWLTAYTDGWLGELEPVCRFEMPSDLLASSSEALNQEQATSVLITRLPQQVQIHLAEKYVRTNCTSDNPLEQAAYKHLETKIRQRLHDEQERLLIETGQWSWYLGAIPFHRKRGSCSLDCQISALMEAMKYCMHFGYYEAARDFGEQARMQLNWLEHIDTYWFFTEKMAIAHLALGEPEKAEALYHEARALATDIRIHRLSAYMIAMLYTRYYPVERRDYQVAKGWLQTAILITTLAPFSPEDRAFGVVLNENALALIEMRQGHVEQALHMVSRGIECLDELVKDGQHPLHRATIISNRGQVYAALGQFERAIEDYTTALALEPLYKEYYFERANLYRRLGRDQEAVEDYSRMLAYNLPSLEASYNRALVFYDLGDFERALADCTVVLELDPEHMSALINRASLLYECGEYDSARQDIARGLSINANNASLLCTLGLVEMAEGHTQEAHRALTAALEQDPSLLPAWTNRAILAYEQGEVEATIRDLSSALALEENATVLYNRGLAYQDQEKWDLAIADYTHALQLSEENKQELLYLRGRCYFRLGKQMEAQRDFETHMAMGASPYLAEIARLGFELLE